MSYFYCTSELPCEHWIFKIGETHDPIGRLSTYNTSSQRPHGGAFWKVKSPAVCESSLLRMLVDVRIKREYGHEHLSELVDGRQMLGNTDLLLTGIAMGNHNEIPSTQDLALLWAVCEWMGIVMDNTSSQTAMEHSGFFGGEETKRLIEALKSKRNVILPRCFRPWWIDVASEWLGEIATY